MLGPPGAQLHHDHPYRLLRPLVALTLRSGGLAVQTFDGFKVHPDSMHRDQVRQDVRGYLFPGGRHQVLADEVPAVPFGKIGRHAGSFRCLASGKRSFVGRPAKPPAHS